MTNFNDRIDRIDRFLEDHPKSVKTTKIILALVAVAGIVTVISIAPGLTMLAKPFLGQRKYEKKKFTNAYTSLERGAFVKKKKNFKGTWDISLTKKGEKTVQKIILDDLKIGKSLKWDHRWRFVIFDIPAKFSKRRNAFRFKIKDFGFHKYQKSVWVFPYPCAKEIEILIEFYKLDRYVDLLEVVDFKGSSKLKKVFDL